ncbi:hypothetical protein Tco_0032488, partial [Tanacetum coccineum]
CEDGEGDDGDGEGMRTVISTSLRCDVGEEEGFLWFIFIRYMAALYISDFQSGLRDVVKAGYGANEIWCFTYPGMSPPFSHRSESCFGSEFRAPITM